MNEHDLREAFKDAMVDAVPPRPVTADAVRSFQTGSGLPATGVADRATLAALGFDVTAVPG